jgi:hypothetical protein
VNGWVIDKAHLQKAFGTNYGLTAKIPKDALVITAGKTKEHAADNGSGSVVHREFCDNCGSFICEYGVSFPSGSSCTGKGYGLIVWV